VNKKTGSAKSNPGWFRKGRSGNPGGRPTTSPTSRGSVFDIVVEKTLTVTHHGRTREITMEEALQQRTYRDAVAGQRMAQREVVKWILKREAWLAKQAPKASWRPIERHISPDPDNVARMALEPWLVEAALDRLDGTLSNTEQRIIMRATRTPHKVKWLNWWSEKP
jgi:Family of unknown function (DUF5681)